MFPHTRQYSRGASEPYARPALGSSGARFHLGGMLACCIVQACGSGTTGLVLWEPDGGSASNDATSGGGPDAALDVARLNSDSGGQDVAGSIGIDACGPDAGLGNVLVLGGQPTFSQQHGGLTTGTQYFDVCPSNRAVIGYQGFMNSTDAGVLLVGPSGLPSTVVGGIETVCGALSLGGPASNEVTVGAPTTFPLRGNGRDSQWAQLCPTNQIVIGFFGRSGIALDQVQFECAHWTVPNACNSPSVDTRTLLLPAGGDGGVAFQDGCPVGQMAIGSAIRAGSWVDAFGLVCGTPLRTFDGGM